MRRVPPTRLPLARWPIFATTEPELARQHVTELYTGHRLHLPSGGDPLDARLNSGRFGGTALAAVTYGGEVAVESVEPRPFAALVLPLAGEAVLRLGEDEVHATPHAGAIVSPADRFWMSWSPDCAVLVLRVEADNLEDQLTELLGHRISRPLRFAPRLDLTSGVGLSISTTLSHVVTELDRPGSLIDHPLLWQHLEHAVMTGILLTHAHNHTEALRTARTPASPSARQLDVALALLEAHPEQRWTLPALADRVGPSARSLQRAFRTHRDRTFHDYLTQVRLRRVRRQLRAYTPDAITVSEVATRWGFLYNGYFVDLYRRQYGQTPTETLHQ